MIITIDGPAGAGKSTAAKALAARLEFDFLDTGAMYRGVAVAALRAGVDLHDQQALARLIDTLRLEVSPGRVVVNGEDLSAAIRSAETTAATGPVASSPVVRRFLAEIQRRIAAGRNIVCEGRDQGTVVFPAAACKFFLVAEARERALRRQREMDQRGEQVDLDELLRAIEARDQRDAARDLAPMVPAPDAVIVDSTGLSALEVVDRMEAEVRRRMSSISPG
jgi:cytidylate kinase